MPSSSSSFGIDAKNYFLTYPRCSLSATQALEQIKQLQTPVNKKYIRVCQEQHEDGSPHLHALLQFEAKYQCKNNRFFDLVSPNRSAHFHPNIQGAKSSSDVKSYIEKDGVFVEWGEFGVDARSARGGQLTVNEAFAAALNTGSKSMALQTIKELAPRYYLLQFHKLNANFDRIFATPTSDFVSEWDPSSFQIPDDLEQWLGEAFKLNDEGSATQPVQNNGVDRPKSLIIEGESRTGKTAWARSLGPHNYICGHLDFNPKVFKNNVAYNVIDDVPPQELKLKHWKELLGAKHDWQSKGKYKPVQIKGGIPSVVLCSPGPKTSYKEFLEKPKNAALKQWTLENAWFVTIKEPLYRSQHQDPTHTGQEKGDTQKTNSSAV